MIRRVANMANIPGRSEADVRRGLREWAPLLLLTPVALILGRSFSPWCWMWILAVAIFAGFKWETWCRAAANGAGATGFRSLAYLFLWPGMDARRFLAQRDFVARPQASAWIWAIAKAVFGAVLLWGLARFAGNELLAGWIGMIGVIFFLHFGLFDGVTLFWQRQGIPAQAVMRAPILATSLGDFWGRRWNPAFRDIVFDLVFRPLAGRIGIAGAMMTTFLVSGLIHDLVISVPAGGGYGLPTLYFVIQGLGILVERSAIVAALERRRPFVGRVFSLVVVVAPIGLLFSPLFVRRVFVPFMQVIHAF